MRSWLELRWPILWLLLAAPTGLRAAEEAALLHPLVWDAMEKRSEPKATETVAQFVFQVKNASAQPVVITNVRPSCGCTTVDLPPIPWALAPGESGTVRATVDFRGKEGEVDKALFIASSAGAQTLLLHVKVPAMDEAARKRNQELAAANRQAVFRDDCARCHAMPAAGKDGEELFTSACAICHISGHRASMVPDLFVAREHRDAAWWTKWITEGREGSLMPAFARRHGGPLTETQIESLVDYLLANLPTEPRKN